MKMGGKCHASLTHLHYAFAIVVFEMVLKHKLLNQDL
jgi:hypothetical protein